MNEHHHPSMTVRVKDKIAYSKPNWFRWSMQPIGGSYVEEM